MFPASQELEDPLKTARKTQKRIISVLGASRVIHPFLEEARSTWKTPPPDDASCLAFLRRLHYRCRELQTLGDGVIFRPALEGSWVIKAVEELSGGLEEDSPKSKLQSFVENIESAIYLGEASKDGGSHQL